MQYPQEHISVTQINMYLRCPAQFYFRYVEGLKMPPTGALTLGKSIHAAFEHNYKQKIETHKDLPVKDVQEVFADDFDRSIPETQLEEGETASGLKDQGVNLVKVYQTTHAPTIQPIAAEQEFTIDVGIPLLGYIDVITDKKEIIDHKVYGKTPTQDKVNKNLQLTAYALAYKTMYGQNPSMMALDCLIKNKEPKIVRLSTTTNEASMQRFIKIAQKVKSAVESEIFYPNEDNFLCSPKYCGYWNLCHKEF